MPRGLSAARPAGTSGSHHLSLLSLLSRVSLLSSSGQRSMPGCCCWVNRKPAAIATPRGRFARNDPDADPGGCRWVQRTGGPAAHCTRTAPVGDVKVKLPPTSGRPCRIHLGWRAWAHAWPGAWPACPCQQSPSSPECGHFSGAASVGDGLARQAGGSRAVPAVGPETMGRRGRQLTSPGRIFPRQPARLPTPARTASHASPRHRRSLTISGPSRTPCE
jgi:hypothetical protein